MSCGAESNQYQNRYIEEVTPGTAPATGDMQILRNTGLAGGVDKSSVQSNEIRDDRQVTDQIKTKLEPNFTINGEFSWETWDDFLEAALFGDWAMTDYDSLTNTVDADETGGVYTYILPAGHGITLVPGGKYKVAGFTNPENNGIKTVVSQVGDVVTVEEELVDETAVADVTVQGAVLVNGVEKHTYTVEDDFTDVIKTRTRTGSVVNSFVLTLAQEAVASVAIEFIGQNTTVQDNSVVVGTPIEPNANDVMNTGDDVGDIYEGGTLQSLVNTISITFANNLRGNNAVGSTENICVAAGELDVNGDFNSYFLDWTFYQKFLDNAASSLRFKIGDANGDYYFNIPKIKIPTSEINAGGPNQDVIATSTYVGLADLENTGKTIIISKIAA